MDKSKNKNRTLIVKIVCLLLSLGLWLYVSNVENPLRTYELKNVPVELINVNSLADSKLAISNKEEFTVDLKLEGPSNEIIKVKKEDFKLVADMSAYALKNGDNSIPVQVTNSPENINIKNNGFLGIKVNLEELVQQEITIKSEVKVTYKQNIYEKQQSINPKTVIVTGGKSSVDKINNAVLAGEEKDVEQNKQNEYNIKFLDSVGNEITNVESNVKTAKLSIVVTNGKVLPINVKTSGSVPQGYIYDGYELSKNSINVFGDNDALSKLDSIDTESVDMSSLQADTDMDVKLKLPSGISAEESQKTVKVKFKVKKEEETTKDIACNVQYKNLNEAFTTETQNLTTNVTLTGSQAALDKISTKNINAVLDLSNVKEEGTFSYKPQATLIDGGNVTVSDIGSVSIVIKKKD